MLRLGRDEGGPVRNQQSKSQGLSQEHLLGPSLHSPPALRLSSVAVLVFSTPDRILYPHGYLSFQNTYFTVPNFV